MTERTKLLMLARAMAELGPLEGLPAAYQPQAVGHSLRRIALKPSRAKRAKVKAARKQRQRTKP